MATNKTKGTDITEAKKPAAPAAPPGDVAMLRITPAAPKGFLLFEPGSADDGALPVLPAGDPIAASFEVGEERIFKGEIAHRDGAVYLDASGVVVELFTCNPATLDDDALRAERARAARLFGGAPRGAVAIVGSQAGARIVNARLDGADEGKSAKILKGAERAAFERLAAILDKHPAALRDPAIVTARLGYKLDDEGWITARPAIVVTADTTSVSALARLKRELLHALHLGEDQLDVTAAPPADQLEKRAQASGDEAVLVEDAAEAYALPLWDRASPAEGMEAAKAAKKPRAPQKPVYVPPDDVALDEVTDGMTLTCHSSPDAGWPTLGAFFGRVKKTLTIGMYDFTAPHVFEGLKHAMVRSGARLRLIVDPKIALSPGGSGDGPKANDISEEDVRDGLAEALEDRFEFTWAAVKVAGKTTGAIFPTAYHIKVAVADRKSFWLSSGNWQSTNQPDLHVEPMGEDAGRMDVLRTYNREWHVIVDHAGLAATYEAFLKSDMAQAKHFQATADGTEAAAAGLGLLVPEDAIFEAAKAPRFFPPLKKRFSKTKPLRIQPILTPDNYVDRVLPFIQGAKSYLWFQNQYIKVSKKNEQGFLDLVDALLARQDEKGFDLRIILRDGPDARQMLESLQAYGFDLTRIKVQPGCHNKGILLDLDDGTEAVVIGSHNWSNDGTVKNRDASLVIYDTEVAHFYKAIYQYDWENLARQRLFAETAFGDHLGMPEVTDGSEAGEAGDRIAVGLDYFDD